MSHPIKILLAEDEPALGMIVKESLETRNFEVLLCEDGEKALKTFKIQKPELLVLDVMMPKLDGFSLANQIRKQDKQVPIIFLTAKSQTKDVVEGFELGGNDYLKKPFSMEELIVRIKALLNKVQQRKSKEFIAIGSYKFNYIKQQLLWEDETTLLTHREAELLYQLIENQNEVLDRSEVLKRIWGDDDFFNARSMDVFISKLRKKLAKDSSIKIINIRGYGYKLVQ